jgi:hypothetical protein
MDRRNVDHSLNPEVCPLDLSGRAGMLRHHGNMGVGNQSGWLGSSESLTQAKTVESKRTKEVQIALNSAVDQAKFSLSNLKFKTEIDPLKRLYSARPLSEFDKKAAEMLHPEIQKAKRIIGRLDPNFTIGNGNGLGTSGLGYQSLQGGRRQESYGQACKKQNGYDDLSSPVRKDESN